MSKLPALTTFGPEIQAALIKGSREEVVIDLPYHEAVVLRQRMHQLRARMREDKHPLTPIVNAAKITIRWSEDVATSTTRKGMKYPTIRQSIVQLVIRPQDSTFRQALERAGVSIDIPDPIPLSVDDISGDDVIEEFLKERK